MHRLSQIVSINDLCKPHRVQALANIHVLVINDINKPGPARVYTQSILMQA